MFPRPHDCGRMQSRAGRLAGYLLNHHGMVKGEATMANLPDGRIWLARLRRPQNHDMDWLHAHIGADEDVQIKSLTE